MSGSSFRIIEVDAKSFGDQRVSERLSCHSKKKRVSEYCSPYDVCGRIWSVTRPTLIATALGGAGGALLGSPWGPGGAWLGAKIGAAALGGGSLLYCSFDTAQDAYKQYSAWKEDRDRDLPCQILDDMLDSSSAGYQELRCAISRSITVRPVSLSTCQIQHVFDYYQLLKFMENEAQEERALRCPVCQIGFHQDNLHMDYEVLGRVNLICRQVLAEVPNPTSAQRSAIEQCQKTLDKFINAAFDIEKKKLDARYAMEKEIDQNLATSHFLKDQLALHHKLFPNRVKVRFIKREPTASAAQSSASPSSSTATSQSSPSTASFTPSASSSPSISSQEAVSSKDAKQDRTAPSLMRERETDSGSGKDPKVEKKSAESLYIAERKNFMASIGYRHIREITFSKSFVETVDFMNRELKKQNKKLGSAVINGDCFYHTFAQGINFLFPDQAPVTIITLREEVGQYIQQKRNQRADEWIQAKYTQWKAVLGVSSYEEFCRNISKPWSENYTPLWGGSSLEGRILCELHNVNLRTWLGIFTPSEGVKTCALDNNECISIQNARGVVEIGCLVLRNHYAPIFPLSQ